MGIEGVLDIIDFFFKKIENLRFSYGVIILNFYCY